MDIDPCDAARFWARVDQKGDDECWPWMLARSPWGYGKIKIRGKHLRAHRVAYALAKGPFDVRLFVCHTCDNPPCCNPRHLFIGTARDNNADVVAKGRAAGAPRGLANGSHTHPERRPRGERNGTAVLTAEKVLEMRRRFVAGENYTAIGKRFGVGHVHVRRVIHGEIWREAGGIPSTEYVASRMQAARIERAREMTRRRVAARATR